MTTLLVVLGALSAAQLLMSISLAMRMSRAERRMEVLLDVLLRLTKASNA